MSIAVRIETADGHVTRLEQRDGESDEGFRKRVNLVIALLQDGDATTTNERRQEPAAISAIRAAIKPKR